MAQQTYFQNYNSFSLSILRSITLIAIVFSVTQWFYAVVQHDTTYDEPYHLAWNVRLLEKHITERESISNFNSPTPILIPNLFLANTVQSFCSLTPKQIQTVRRSFNLVWLLGIIGLTHYLGHKLAGKQAAYLASTATALDPNIIAHASLLTVDAAYAFSSLAALSALLLFSERASITRSLLVGLTFGLAFTSKFSAVLLLAGIVLLPLALPQPPKLKFMKILRGGIYCTLGLLIAFAVICSAYLFVRVGIPFEQLDFRHKLFRSLAFSLSNLPLPLPADFIKGIDICLSMEGGQTWNVIVLGQLYDYGVWFYFFVVWLIKTPIFSILGVLLGFYYLLRSQLLFFNPRVRFIFLNFVVFLSYFSFLFKTQVGFRYALMCLPLGYLLAAAGISQKSWRKNSLLFYALATLVSISELLFYSGNMLSFTNILIQPKRNVYRLLADSNIDWGQNRDKLQDFLDEDGIENTSIDPVHILPGHNIISINQLVGVWWNFQQHQWIRKNLNPEGHYGHTYLWYNISKNTFDTFLNESRSYAGRTNLPANCNPFIPFTDKIALSSQSQQRLSICLQVPEKLIFKIFNSEKELKFGPKLSNGICAEEKLSSNKTAWYQLGKGYHEFCVNSDKGFKAILEISSGAAEISEGRTGQ